MSHAASPEPSTTEQVTGETADGRAAATAGGPQPLVHLGDSDLTLADPDDDVRGRRVHDVAREDLGVVDDLLVDPEHQRVRMLVISTGGLLGIGAERSYLPVEAVTDITDEVVRIGQDRHHVAAAPVYDPDLTDGPPLVDRLGYYGSVYGYYGYMPFWRDSTEG